jgi:hypothetical protein
VVLIQTAMYAAEDAGERCPEYNPQRRALAGLDEGLLSLCLLHSRLYGESLYEDHIAVTNDSAPSSTQPQGEGEPCALLGEDDYIDVFIRRAAAAARPTPPAARGRAAALGGRAMTGAQRERTAVEAVKVYI